MFGYRFFGVFGFVLMVVCGLVLWHSGHNATLAFVGLLGLIGGAITVAFFAILDDQAKRKNSLR